LHNIKTWGIMGQMVKGDEGKERVAPSGDAAATVPDSKINWDRWVLAEDGTYERRYGVHRSIELDATKILMLTQVRGSRNPAFDSLWESIESTDMNNQPTVSQLNAEELNAYILAINVVWNSEHAIEEFDAFLHPDGSYYLAGGGHTRTLAVLRSMEEVTRETGKPARASIGCTINEAKTPLEIMALQISDNTYSAPSPEVRAIGIVESFYYGIAMGHWKDKHDFLAKNSHQVNSALLKDALAFIELPDKARENVFNKDIHYSSGVFIGAASAELREWAMYKANFRVGIEVDDDLALAYEEVFELKVAELMAHIKTKNLSATRAITFLKGQLLAVQEELTAWKIERDGEQVPPENPGLFPPILVDPREQADAVKAKMRRTHSELRRQVARGALASSARFLRVDGELTRIGDSDSVVTDAAHAYELLAQHAGRKTAESIAIVSMLADQGYVGPASVEEQAI
jgi:hypothetical protein